MTRRFLLFIFSMVCFLDSLAAIKKNSTLQETEIVLQTDNGNLFGSLLLPGSNRKKVLVIIIAGSGPTDRNGNSPMATNNCLKILAYELAKRKIASLRFDKRGVSKSMSAVKDETELHFDDYVADAKKWVQLMKADKRFKKIIIIGHSEGSLIGMLAADSSSKFISIAGPGRPADEILKEQLAAQPQLVQNICYPIIDSLKAGNLVSTINPMVNSLFRPSVQPYLISWFKYNPSSVIRNLSIPILIIQGTKDLQVKITDAELLQQSGKNSKLFVVENMNHVIKIIEGDNDQNKKSYNDPGLPVSDKLTKKIARFAKK